LSNKVKGKRVRHSKLELPGFQRERITYEAKNRVWPPCNNDIESLEFPHF